MKDVFTFDIFRSQLRSLSKIHNPIGICKAGCFGARFTQSETTLDVAVSGGSVIGVDEYDVVNNFKKEFPNPTLTPVFEKPYLE